MENTHIASRFDKDLSKIKGRILDMGNLVIAQIREATGVLEDFDAAKVDRLVATDLTINGMYKDIHIRVERLIALRQPMALDLRETLAPTQFASDLERIGDIAKSTAKRSRKLRGFSDGQDMTRIIQEMSTIIQSMLAGILIAYKNSDIELAAEIRARDVKVDALDKALFAQAITAIRQNPDNAEALAYIILMSRNFERVGDHVVNMARYVHQIATGEDLKAS